MIFNFGFSIFPHSRDALTHGFLTLSPDAGRGRAATSAKVGREIQGGVRDKGVMKGRWSGRSGTWREPVEGDVAFSLRATEIEGEASIGWLVEGANFSTVVAVVADDAKGGTSGSLFEPAPVWGNTLGYFVDARNLESTSMIERHGAVTSANLFSLSRDIE